MEPRAWGETWPHIHPPSVPWVWVRWKSPFLRKMVPQKPSAATPPLAHPAVCPGEAAVIPNVLPWRREKCGHKEQVLARESPQKELYKGETQGWSSEQHRAAECLLAHGKADICGWGPAGMSSLLSCDQRGLPAAPCSFSKASE